MKISIFLERIDLKYNCDDGKPTFYRLYIYISLEIINSNDEQQNKNRNESCCSKHEKKINVC